jgi:SAM-dependent methyltransferase
VAPLWRDCFDQLFTETVGLPDRGRVLLVECGTGGLAVEIAARLRETGSVTASDADPDRLALASDKANIANLDNIRFLSLGKLAEERLTDAYDLVIGDASLLPAGALATILKTLRAGVTYDGTAAAYVVSRGTFDEFFSIYWEALYNCELAEQLGPALETLLLTHPTKADIEEQAAAAGWRNVGVTIIRHNIGFESGTSFIESPLIAEHWLDGWLKIVPADRVADVKAAIVEIIEREREGLTFEIGLKAALVTGNRRAEGVRPDEDDEEAEDELGDDFETMEDEG